MAGEEVIHIFDLSYWVYHGFDTTIERGQRLPCCWRPGDNPPILAVRQGDPAWVGQRLKAVHWMGPSVDLAVRLRGNQPSHPQMHHDVRWAGCGSSASRPGICMSPA